VNAALAGVAAFYAVVWLLSAPQPKVQVLNLFHVFVPLTLALGIRGLARALLAARREGWSDRVEGLAVLSFLALAWGHYGALTAIRRAADAAGYEEATQFDTSRYRLATGVLLVVASALVWRWLTRDVYGEWGWAAILLAWATVVMLGQPYLQAALVWIYEAVVI
jgi:hypothetical protein